MTESQYKGNSGPFVKGPMVDEEGIRTSHWLRLLLYVSFSTLTLTVEWREGHGPKNLVPLIIRLVNGVDKIKQRL